MILSPLFHLCLVGTWMNNAVVTAFTIPTTPTTISTTTNARSSSNAEIHNNPRLSFTKSQTALQMSYNNNNNNNNNNNRNGFDLSKPTLDLFSLRTVRNDALLQYSSLNQSEPLRINLYLIGTIISFSFPTISESVIGEIATLPSTIASTIVGISSFALFIKECQSRSKQLDRIEKEMNAESLQVILSTTNKLNPVLYDGSSTTLSTLRGKKRIIAISGTTEELKKVLIDFRIFRKRLTQSNSLVIPVPTDSSNSNDKEWYKLLGVTETDIRSCQWLAQPQDVSQWKEYFNNLVEDSNANKDENTNSNINSNNKDLTWFGLNYNGRSFASGNKSRPPMLLQILGQNLRPIDFLDESDDADIVNAANREVDVTIVKEVQECQTKFYNALTGGDLKQMNMICSKQQSKQVSEVLSAGGRIDNWQSCLAEDAKPTNMKTSGSDFLIVSPTLAYSTCIEFPVVSGGGYDNASAFGATLLAVQRWTKDDDDDDNDNEWKLEYHSTIPWSADSRAGGMLRCDCRGCVALTRGPEKRTFGGLIG